MMRKIVRALVERIYAWLYSDTPDPRPVVVHNTFKISGRDPDRIAREVVFQISQAQTRTTPIRLRRDDGEASN